MAQGLEFMWVQVFACRRSQVILRYVAIAPLESATCFRRQQSTASLSAVGFENLSADERSLMQKLNSFMAEEEIKIRELCELVKVGAACARTTSVHNKVSSVWHRVATEGLDSPPVQWQLFAFAVAV